MGLLIMGCPFDDKMGLFVTGCPVCVSCHSLQYKLYIRPTILIYIICTRPRISQGLAEQIMSFCYW
jgi:hypothetical protein